MRNFKKRTIALVLASVVTVAGSFASEHFKNSLMGLTFETAENGVMSMVVQTKIGYSGNLTPLRRDANTYILTLPEMDSKAPTPDLSQNPHVQSVNIRTMPYTNNGSGYTRITIKTNNLNNLPVQQRIYLPDKKEFEYSKETEQEKLRKLEQLRLEEEKERFQKENEERMAQEEAQAKLQENTETKNTSVQEETSNIEEEPAASVAEPIDISSTYATKEEKNEALLLILGVLVIIFVAYFCYIKAKDTMIELSGESLDIDVKDENSVKKDKPEKKDNTKKINKIKNTIKTLDSTYAKSSVRQQKNEYTQKVKQETEAKPVEEVNVVDLDKLFQEQVLTQKNEQVEDDDENQALEDFLSGFSFDEEYGLEEVEEEELYDVELFEQIINGNFKFSKDEIDCMEKLLQSEIQDETFRNIRKYLVSNPMQKSKEKVLEEIMTTYAISQNINFSGQEVDTLYKLINLEIDSDFITDLRTNPERTKEVEKEIKESKNKVRKPSEIITLKVSEALPDLSEALKKQGNNKIDSNYKPQTVYFSEGYDVATLSINSELPDLSKEINNKNAYISKPSEKIELVDNSYKVKTLSISSELPDLTKIMQNPSSYEQEEAEEIIVDEKALIENISNVQFKPFDDNSQNFEVLNDFDDFYAVDNSNPDDVLSFDEIAAEFEELYSETITNNKQDNVAPQPEANIEIVSEDKKENDIVLEENIVEPIADIELNTIQQREKVKIERTNSATTQDILDRIKERRDQKNNAVFNQNKNNEIKKESNFEKNGKDEKNNQSKICVLDNESYEILSTVNFLENKGCYLTKHSNGYFVIGFIENKLFNIKTYNTLKSEKIQARLSEKLPNGNLRYIVRIGINKFILDLEKNNIKFVMDLC